MKKFVTVLASIFCLVLNVHTQYTNIPDKNFEQWLIDLAYKAPPIEGRVETRLIRNIQSVTISGKGVKNLTGIENFEGMTTFSASGSRFDTLDLSNNKKLQTINCNDCNLSKLDLSANKAVTRIFVDRNVLSELILPDSSIVEDLYCNGNQLTTLNLKTVFNLANLYCDSNQIEKLDLSAMRRMRRFYATHNNLKELKLPIANPNGVPNFNLKNNPNLTCIEVGDSNSYKFYSIYSSSKDSTASYQLKCRKIEKPSFVNEKIKPNGFQLFPNPTTGQVHIISPFQEYSIALFDGLGSKVLDRKGVDSETIEFTIDTDPGVYYLNVSDTRTGVNYVERLVVY